jgi:methionyl-tRNA synthetase
MKPFYVTTPLYYVNDVPHIGHAYTTIAADVLARWKRLRGREVFFLTGTDEHGDKIAQAAAAAGLEPGPFADGVVSKFQALWSRLGVTNDDFIRTTEPRHAKVVQEVFALLRERGDIYMGAYEGWYCVPDETFWSDTEVLKPEGADGVHRCPDCRRPVERLKEESYFFRLSKYEQPLLEHITAHPEFLQPAFRAPEVVNFVKQGLRDLSVSRTRVKWGIPVPGDPGHTVYVWFDALLNYLTAGGYGGGQGPGGGERLEPAPSPQSPVPIRTKDEVPPWPADVHLIGKEILRFHAVIWPAVLMALGLPLPRTVFAHGWWTVEGDKMSKSKGNVVDPHAVADEFGVDALRYFLLREVPFGGDGDFSRKALLSRYNAELANSLGNLLNRTLQLVEKNCDGKIPSVASPHELAGERMLPAWIAKLDAAMDRLAFNDALQQIVNLMDACNKYMDDKAPWKAVKTDPLDAFRTLHDVLRALKLAAVALSPFMPAACEGIWRQLGETEPLPGAARRILSEGGFGFRDAQPIRKDAPLFPRKQGIES